MAMLAEPSESTTPAETTGLPPRLGLRRRSALDPVVLLNGGLAALNRGLHLIPACRWLARRALRELEVTPLRVPITGLGAGLHGLRLAFLSDLHAGSYLEREEFVRVFQRVADLEPDMVLLGGDLVNCRHRELDHLAPSLAACRPPLGLFAVPGNHDYFRGVDVGSWRRVLRQCGVELLRNRGVQVERGGDVLWLAGVDDYDEGEPDLGAALAEGPPGVPRIVLAHHPDYFPHCVAAGVELTLSGHTHGGQIRLLGRAPVTHSALGFCSGEYARGASRLVVSRGVGVTLFPIRSACRPEILAVELLSADI